MGKQMTSIIKDLAITFGSNNNNKKSNYEEEMKRKTGSDKKCYNCHKLRYYAQDYTLLNKRQTNKNENKRGQERV